MPGNESMDAAKGSGSLSNVGLLNESAKSSPSVTSPERNGAAGNVLESVLAGLDDAKAEDVVSIEIGSKSSLGDHMVVASGRSHRHVGAIADNLVEHLKRDGFGPLRVEGLPHCDWVLIDAGDVIVHVFRPEVREFYNIEKMWLAEPYSERRVQA